MALKVLIAGLGEDERDYAARALAGQGFEVLETADAAGAATEFPKMMPDAVVLGIGPGCAGAAALIDFMKTSRPSTAVVAVGSAGLTGHAVEAMRMGADEFLPRPLASGALADSVRKNISRARRESLREHSVKLHSGLPGETFAPLFMEAPAALLTLSPGFEIRIANSAAVRMLGIKPEQIPGFSFGTLVSHRIRERWFKHVRKEAGGLKGYHGHLHLKGGDGEWFPAEVKAREAPDKTGIILFVTDLTRQKDMERHLIESKKLASLGHLVEGVAHEVRNPLIAIGGFARKLKASPALQNRESQYVDIILSEVERLEHMVAEIEDYQAFVKKKALEFAPVKLGRMIREAAGSGEWLHRINADFPEGPEDIIIYGDRAMLTELFRVLAENAREAMPGGGEITISCTAEDGTVAVRITDTGVGIKPGDMENLFDPFFTSKTKGAGLGLAKAYMIAEDHGGSIHFESVPGKGTNVTVTLPVDRRTAAGTAEFK